MRTITLVLTVPALLIGGCNRSAKPVAAAESGVVVFPAPKGVEASEDWSLSVEGREVFCYRDYRLNTDFPPSLHRMRVSPQAYAIFDFEGRVRIRATIASKDIADLKGLKVRPLALGIRPKVEGRTVEFELDRAADVTVDPLGTGVRVLHIFTNPPEKDPPRQGDPNVVWFGHGVHDIEDLELKAGQTLYLAGGAVLRPLPVKPARPEKERHYTGVEYQRAVPAIRASGDNVAVRGRGVISGERGLAAGRRFGLFSGSRMKNLRIEGVVFTRASSWTLLMHDCAGSALERVRVLGYFTNSDGICLHSCRDCTVRDCFVHTGDDCYEVKSKAKGVVFERSQAWCDAGTAMGVTHEIDGPVENVAWRDMTVLHYTYRHNPHEGITSRGAIFVHPAFGGTVRNARFEGITVESCATERPLILVYNLKGRKAGEDFAPGKPFSRIEGLTFERIRAENVRNPEIAIMDGSGQGLVRDIVIRDVKINGRELTAGDERIKAGKGVVGVKVHPGAASDSGGQPPAQDEAAVTVDLDPGKTVCESFIGFGAEWDSNAYRRSGVTDEDFRTIAERVRWMRLPATRIMLQTKWYYLGDGRFDFETQEMKDLYRHLDVCQELGSTVFLTDWGIERKWLNAHELTEVTDPKYARAVAACLKHLVEVKKYSCIKYFIFGNEPNHQVKDFDRWKKGYLNFMAEFSRLGLNKRVKPVGPDVGMAPHGLESHKRWFQRGVDELSGQARVWDIHRYEQDANVRSGQLAVLIGELLDYSLKKDPNAKSVPKPFIVAEAGMRDGSKPPATNENIGTYRYGVFMADYGVQAANAGAASVLAWMLDDSSHWDFSWGMWDRKANGLKLRPWFYTWSLLCRFVPAGSRILQSESPDRELRVLASLSDDPRAPGEQAWTFCLVNRATEAKSVRLRVKDGARLELSRYVYAQNSARKDREGFPEALDRRTYDLGAGAVIKCEADSVTVLSSLRP